LGKIQEGKYKFREVSRRSKKKKRPNTGPLEIPVESFLAKTPDEKKETQQRRKKEGNARILITGEETQTISARD